MSTKQLLDVTLSSDIVTITIGRKTLLNFLTTSDRWPVNGDTNKPLKIEDKELFFDELISHLMEEDEQGATPLHVAFETACESLLESGTEAIEEPQPYDDNDGEFPMLDDDEDY